MSTFKIQPKSVQKGFALLLAIIVSVVVLTIGLSILSSSLKQQLLTDLSQESERAFHAAYAGVECAQFWNIDDRWDVATPTSLIRCIEQNVTTDNSPAHTNNADEVFTVQFDWQNADNADGTYTYDMCTQITVYKYFDGAATTDMSILPFAPTDPLRTCNIGVECTVVQSRGYNRSCANLADIRTVEREVTVRF